MHQIRKVHHLKWKKEQECEVDLRVENKKAFNQNMIWTIGKGSAYSKLDCNAGTFRSSKVNTVTNPNAPAANHSGTAAKRGI